MEIDLSITIYPEPWQQADFIIFVSNPDLLQFSSTILKQHTTSRGVTQISLSTHISLRVDTISESTIDGIDGMSIVRMHSLDSSFRCLEDQHIESLVIGGCPPGKHIRVRKRNAPCSEWKDMSYTIRKDLYDPTFLLGRTNVGAQDKMLTYDLDELGCPFLVHYADPFKPIIDLFDEEEFVEEVLVNYVVYDINGRFTYTYTMTTAEALCASQAQNWITMLQTQEPANPYTAWTNKNFVNCYKNSESRLLEPENAYEIMNSSSSNKIKWQPYSGLYVFNVTVVDPNYSFCSLNTQFAVEVYGALPEAPFPQMRIMLGLCGFGVLFVWLMYTTYNVLIKSEVQNNKD
ncbi:cation channel sperm-associated protein subunit delta-like [Anneissia japonica]|uniref:cation channel sperm-associated protein subunit delta-like n=1 Tax=Anneissia japonica TaxID=1529436 RepID=UPI00142584B6|nr:cation channel sperm-associated protein subunit delta-like [Anneissia japonica]